MHFSVSKRLSTHSSASRHTHIVQVVVEVHAASTQVPAQESGVCGEDGGHWQLTETTQEETNARQPLMEVGYHHGRGTRETG